MGTCGETRSVKRDNPNKIDYKNLNNRLKSDNDILNDQINQFRKDIFKKSVMDINNNEINHNKINNNEMINQINGNINPNQNIIGNNTNFNNIKLVSNNMINSTQFENMQRLNNFNQGINYNLNNNPNNFNNFNNQIFNNNGFYLSQEIPQSSFNINNNFVNTNNFGNTIKFTNTCGGEILIPVNEQTTIGNIVSTLKNKWNIGNSKKLLFITPNNSKEYDSNESTLFKTLSIKPNQAIIVKES